MLFDKNDHSLQKSPLADALNAISIVEINISFFIVVSSYLLIEAWI